MADTGAVPMLQLPPSIANAAAETAFVDSWGADREPAQSHQLGSTHRAAAPQQLQVGDASASGTDAPQHREVHEDGATTLGLSAATLPAAVPHPETNGSDADVDAGPGVNDLVLYGAAVVPYDDDGMMVTTPHVLRSVPGGGAVKALGVACGDHFTIMWTTLGAVSAHVVVFSAWWRVCEAAHEGSDGVVTAVLLGCG